MSVSFLSLVVRTLTGIQLHVSMGLTFAVKSKISTQGPS